LKTKHPISPNDVTLLTLNVIALARFLLIHIHIFNWFNKSIIQNVLRILIFFK